MKYNVWIVLILISGCIKDSGSEINALEPDFVTSDGIKIHIESGELLAALDDINDYWIDTQHCLQMTAPTPEIVITEDLSKVCDGPVYDWTDAAHCNNGNGWFIAIKSIVSRIRQRYKHEFIHYVRNANGDLEHELHAENDPLWMCQWN